MKYKTLDIKPYDVEMEVSPNHRLGDFICNDLALTRNMRNQYVSNDTVITNIINVCRYMITPLEQAYGMPFTILFGYRCYELECLLNWEKSNLHRQGLAVDIKPLSGKSKFIQILKNIEFHECIIHRNFWHLSWKEFNRDTILRDYTTAH